LGADRFSEPLVSEPDARAYFLFDGKKKVAKEKATPGSAPLRGSLRYSAGRAARMNSPAAQTMRADCPRPACVAQRLSRGPKGVSVRPADEEMACCGRRPKKGKNQIHCTLSAPDGLPGPLRGAEQRRVVGGLRLALSEPQASLASRPTTRVAQGTGVAGTDPGSPFLCLLSFGEAKESKTPRKGGTPCQLRQQA
jgi:hypothetical protein